MYMRRAEGPYFISCSIFHHDWLTTTVELFKIIGKVNT